MRCSTSVIPPLHRRSKSCRHPKRISWNSSGAVILRKKGALQIIPATQHILDHYQYLTVEEKNRLWKLILKKVTVYRSQDDELSIHLYPNLPQ